MARLRVMKDPAERMKEEQKLLRNRAWSKARQAGDVDEMRLGRYRYVSYSLCMRVVPVPVPVPVPASVYYAATMVSPLT
jgi:hypothetical protein